VIGACFEGLAEDSRTAALMRTRATTRHDGAGALLLQSLVDTMRALALNRQLIKLSLYKWFARTLVRADALPP
jgi:hypothetical protein